MSEEQRQKLSEAQKAYVASDPRWLEHRQKLAAAQIVRRMTLTPVKPDKRAKRGKGFWRSFDPA